MGAFPTLLRITRKPWASRSLIVACAEVWPVGAAVAGADEHSPNTVAAAAATMLPTILPLDNVRPFPTFS